jgi:uncharacterized BrkB/YihY/UPF0761 family membrane protein
MAEDTPPDEHARAGSVGSRVETARMRAEELQRRSLERLERESERRGWVRKLMNAYEADRNRGGGLLAGGLAYRIFLWELPAALVLVTVFGLAAKAGDRAPEDVARSAGLGGAVVATVAAAVHEADRASWWLLLIGLVLMIWAGRSAVRALQIVSEIAWSEREAARPSTIESSLVFSAVALGVIVLQVALAYLHGVVGSLGGWLIGTAVMGVLAVWVMTVLPHGGRSWRSVVPGALAFAAGVRLLTMATAVYFAPKLGRIDDLYGGLGLAIVILLFLYLLARAFVAAAFLNATFAGVSHATLRQQHLGPRTDRGPTEASG